MSRTRRSAKTIGTAFETQLARYLSLELNDDRIDRAPRHGASDRGDIAGVRGFYGHRIVVEAKNCARTDLPGWTTQAHLEAGNADALLGLVIHKRHGNANPGRQWVTCTVDDLLALLTGERHGHRRDQLNDGTDAA